MSKPAGMLMHPSALDRRAGPTLVEFLREQFGKPVHPVHRLDRGASGCLLVAFHAEAAAKMSEFWRTHSVRKRYWIVVRGWIDDSGRIERPLAQDNNDELKPALTEYRCLARAELPEPVGPHPTARYSWADVQIGTGRYHQIRRHFAGESHPVLGDSVYGDGRHNRHLRQLSGGEKRLLLFSRQLEFTHYRTGQNLRITANPDAELDRLLRRIFGPQAAEILES